MDRLTFIGHATALLRLGDARVLTDPVFSGFVGPLRRQARRPQPELVAEADLVLISHQHYDHLDLRSLRRIPPDVPLVVPSGVARLATEAGAREVHELSAGESIALGSVTVHATPALHDGRRLPWGAPVEALGYVVETPSRRVYFAGDTDIFDGMSRLGPLDLALLPVWGWGPRLGEGHLDPGRAARALSMLQPRFAVPIHWGTYCPPGFARLRPGFLSEPPLEFERLAAELAPHVRVRVLQPGSGLALEESLRPAAGVGGG
jgi:L-ascorbate metabolism protein UlaG (beta-lactamase superfamily)